MKLHRIFDWYPLFLRLCCKNNTALPCKSRQLRSLNELVQSHSTQHIHCLPAFTYASKSCLSCELQILPALLGVEDCFSKLGANLWSRRTKFYLYMYIPAMLLNSLLVSPPPPCQLGFLTLLQFMFHYCAIILPRLNKVNKFPIAKKQSIITECDWSDSIWEKEHNNLTIDLACDASV